MTGKNVVRNTIQVYVLYSTSVAQCYGCFRRSSGEHILSVLLGISFVLKNVSPLVVAI